MPAELARFIATWLYSGLSPKAPGTAGSLAALPFAWLIHASAGPIGLLIAAGICFGVGCWAAEVHSRTLQSADPGEIVIDEVAALWLVLAAVPLSVVWYAAGFALFRLFDIWKPWPIRILERQYKGGFGIMVDDVAAAAYGGLILVAIRQAMGS